VTVTEGLMKVGSWSFKLDDAPLSVRQNLDWFANIVITPARIKDPNVDLDDLLAAAVYSGIITKRNQAAGEFGGPGLLGYLQTSKGHCGSTASVSGVPSWPATFTQIIHQWITGTANSNGLDYGTGYSATSTTVAEMDAEDYYPRTKPLLDQAAAQTGNEYRCNPDGTVDWGIYSALFRYNTPTVLVSPGRHGTDGGITALKLSRWDVNADLDDFRNFAWMRSTDKAYTVSTSSAAGSLSSLKGWGGSVVLRYTDRLTTNSTDTGDVADAATAAAALYAEPNYQIDCSVSDFCVPRLLTPGDYLLCYDPENDLTGNYQIQAFFGSDLMAMRLRCVGYTWPIAAGMGVYGIKNGTTTITDLTDFVHWETGSTRLELGSAPRRLRTSGSVTALN
jgi:hypothetical protein